MQKYSEVIGLPVICADSGKKAGVVKDILFYPRQREIGAIIIEKKSTEIKRRAVLPEDILDIGKGAVIIRESLSIRCLKRQEYTERFGKCGNIQGLRIYTRSGEELGTVKDVLFDYRTGIVEGVEVSDGLFQDIYQGRRMLPLFGKVEFAEDNILVDREAIEEMVSNGGGIKARILGNNNEK